MSSCSIVNKLHIHNQPSVFLISVALSSRQDLMNNKSSSHFRKKKKKKKYCRTTQKTTMCKAFLVMSGSVEHKFRNSFAQTLWQNHKCGPSSNAEVRARHLFHPLLPELLSRWPITVSALLCSVSTRCVIIFSQDNQWC